MLSTTARTAVRNWIGVTMSDYIRREDAIEALDFEIVHMTAYRNGKSEGNLFDQYNKGLEDGIKALKALPSADPERKVGEWYHDGSQWNNWICSECEYMWLFRKEEANFCPNCGADMRGDR